MTRRAHPACIAAGALVVALAAPAVAAARVLVHSPQPVIRCGKPIRTGVWYQSFSGGSRKATIRISTSAGTTVYSKRLQATATRWRYFLYRPRCGRRYVVTYTTADGPTRFTVRVRAAS
jgi:hypothetical protein